MQRLLAGTLGVALLIACGPKAPPGMGPRQRAVQRIAEADALVEAGCYDCLADALAKYEEARAVPGSAATATVGAARTALLLAIRERELGLPDTGYLRRAKAIAGSGPEIATDGALAFQIAATIPLQGGGQRAATDEELEAMAPAWRNRADWVASLEAAAGTDLFHAYLYLAFSCAYNTPTRENIVAWLQHIPVWRQAPLVRFKLATCGSYESEALEALLAADARFAEVDYFLGLRAMLSGRLDAAAESLQRASAWRPDWPGVTQLLATVYFTAEDFEQAAAFYDRTLALSPNHPDALLGKTKALTYLGRYEPALAAVDRLLALDRWLIGDARYWRALNELQLARNEEAWRDIALAGALLVDAQVPKLAGMIAFRLQQLETARAKFEESKERNPGDCETIFYLGVVDGELRRWGAVATALGEAAACFEASNRRLRSEIAAARASDEPPERRARQVAKREQAIAQQERMLAQSWFNTAVAYYNLQQTLEARQFAQKVAEDREFGQRAREILERVTPRPPTPSP